MLRSDLARIRVSFFHRVLRITTMTTKTNDDESDDENKDDDDDDKDEDEDEDQDDIECKGRNSERRILVSKRFAVNLKALSLAKRSSHGREDPRVAILPPSALSSLLREKRYSKGKEKGKSPLEERRERIRKSRGEDAGEDEGEDEGEAEGRAILEDRTISDGQIFDRSKTIIRIVRVRNGATRNDEYVVYFGER